MFLVLRSCICCFSRCLHPCRLCVRLCCVVQACTQHSTPLEPTVYIRGRVTITRSARIEMAHQSPSRILFFLIVVLVGLRPKHVRHLWRFSDFALFTERLAFLFELVTARIH